MKFPDPTLPIEQQDEDTLHAMLVWGEARGEAPLARAAVAHVPLTRLNLKKSRSTSAQAATLTLKAIMLARRAFSCFNADDPNRAKLLRPVEHEGLGLWAACWRTASEARNGQSANPAPGATHYVVRRLWSCPAAVPSKPKWFELPCIEQGITKEIATIGGHVFARTA